MASDLPPELRNWLSSLGFSPKNVGTEQIEGEFRRLTPPEVRDIWRNILIHVVPVQEARYIKKVLLLEELGKYASNSRRKPLIPKNLKSIHELRQFNNSEKILKQLDNLRSSIHDVNTKIEELQTKKTELGKKQEHLKKAKEKTSTIFTLEKLKVTSYERLLNKLRETHECLNFACSFWNSSDGRHTANAQSVETMKTCLEKVNEFGKQRLHLDCSSLITHQQHLMSDVVNLTSTVLPSDVQKILISMLHDTLSSLLKMTDHAGLKQQNEDFDKKLAELEVLSVQSFLDNMILQTKIETQQESVRTRQSQLLLLLEKNFKDKLSRKDVDQWLETEFLKHRMTTRQNYLAKREEMMKNSNAIQNFVDFKDEKNREMFFQNIREYQNQLVTLEREITNNLSYKSDESIKIFLTFQKDCGDRMSRFIEEQNSSKKLDFAAKLADSLKREIALLNALHSQSSSKDTSIFETDTPQTPQPDKIVDSTKRYNFVIYLNNACDEFFHKVNRPCPDSAIIDQKRLTITKEENEFVTQLRKLLEKAKNNLDTVEIDAATCAKHIELWGDFSVNDLIPKTMIVADHTFFEWRERYDTIMQRLLKK